MSIPVRLRGHFDFRHQHTVASKSYRRRWYEGDQSRIRNSKGGSPGHKTRTPPKEHDLLELGESARPLHPTDKVQLVPTDGCTTINLDDRFYCTRRDYLEAIWNIAGRGKFS